MLLLTLYDAEAAAVPPRLFYLHCHTCYSQLVNKYKKKRYYFENDNQKIV